MNFIIWLIVGGVIGWRASILIKTKGQQGIVFNFVVDVVGAMLGAWFISALVGIGAINQNNFSLPAMLVSFIGAAILLAIIKSCPARQCALIAHTALPLKLNRAMP